MECRGAVNLHYYDDRPETRLDCRVRAASATAKINRLPCHRFATHNNTNNNILHSKTNLTGNGTK